MNQEERPIHAKDLRKRTRSVLVAAVNHFSNINLNSQFDELQCTVDEYEAGVEMIDQLVDVDNFFANASSLYTVRDSLLYYSKSINERTFIWLKMNNLLDDIDTAIKAAKEASK